jgi:hypothetical protein
MRCLVCDAEMILMKIVPDDTMPVPGFEHQTFMCSACHDVVALPARENQAPLPRWCCSARHGARGYP